MGILCYPAIMARPPVPIRLKPKDLAEVRSLLRGGVQQVRVVLRALALRQLAEGVAAPQVAQSVPLTAKAIRELAHRYNGSGLDGALYDKQRPGASQILDASQKQRIVAMVCSSAPARECSLDGTPGGPGGRQT